MVVSSILLSAAPRREPPGSRGKAQAGSVVVRVNAITKARDGKDRKDEKFEDEDKDETDSTRERDLANLDIVVSLRFGRGVGHQLVTTNQTNN